MIQWLPRLNVLAARAATNYTCPVETQPAYRNCGILERRDVNEKGASNGSCGRKIGTPGKLDDACWCEDYLGTAKGAALSALMTNPTSPAQSGEVPPNTSYPLTISAHHEHKRRTWPGRHEPACCAGLHISTTISDFSLFEVRWHACGHVAAEASKRRCRPRRWASRCTAYA